MDKEYFCLILATVRLKVVTATTRFVSFVNKNNKMRKKYEMGKTHSKQIYIL
jgi:hypothetical protein